MTIGDIGDAIRRARAEAAPRDPHAIATPSLLRAASIPAVARALAGEISERLGHQVHVQIEGHDSCTNTVREWSQGLLDCAEHYPGTPIEMIFSGECDSHAYAESLVDTGVLIFEQTLLAEGARPAYLQRLARDVATGWRLPAAATPMSTAVHEFAHFLDLGLALPGWQQSTRVPGHPDSLKTEVGTVVGRAHRPTSDEVGRELGRYTLTTTEHGSGDQRRKELSELVADSFTDVHMNGLQAHPANATVAHRLDQAILLPGDRIAELRYHQLAQQAIKDRAAAAASWSSHAAAIQTASRTRTSGGPTAGYAVATSRNPAQQHLHPSSQTHQQSGTSPRTTTP